MDRDRAWGSCAALIRPKLAERAAPCQTSATNGVDAGHSAVCFVLATRSCRLKPSNIERKPMRKVRKVTRVKARIIRSKPPVLAVGAQGVVPTAGRKSVGLLRPGYKRTPPARPPGLRFVGA